jgi:CubicO group peptidase (beta-lactamase class C family)
MKKLFMLLVASCFMVLSVGAQTKVKDSKTHYAQEALQPYVDNGQLAGAISVFYKDGVQETLCIGYADVAQKRPIKMDNVYMQCSQTKGFCGVTIAKLVEEGKLSLDDPVSKYLPEYADIRMRDGSRPKRELTLRDLLSHTDGMRWEYPLVNNDISVRQAARLYMAKGLKYQPGETFAYGTMRFSVAAACLEVAVGERFEDYLKRKILDPLEMTDTTFSPNASQLKRLVSAYTSNGKPLRPASDRCARQLVFPKERPLRPAPGGGLFSTPADVIRFSQMLAHHGERKGVRIISRKTFDEVFAVVQVPGELGRKNPYSAGAWIYGDWFGHEGAMRTDQRANLKTGQSRLFFIQTENKAGDDFFALKRAWHAACDKLQNTPTTEFGR